MTKQYYNTEAYLKQFTPEQWLEATIKVYQDNGIGVITVEMMRLGFNLNNPDGWKLVAPAWLEGFEVEGIKSLEEFKNDQTF